MKAYKLLTLLLLIPNNLSMNVGELRLTWYRVFLLVFVLLNMGKWIEGRKRMTGSIDCLLLGYCIWAMVCLSVNHGMDRAVESGGIFFAETFGAYLVGRMAIQSGTDINQVPKFFIATISWLFIATLPEMLFGVNLVWKVSESFGGYALGSLGERLGMTRASGPFDHPILNGVVCAAILGFAFKSDTRGRARRVLLVAGSAFTSLSSGAVASMMSQALVAWWLLFASKFKSPWRLLGLVVLIGYVVIDLLSNRSGIKVILSYLTFSPGTAQWRLIIWEFGMENVYKNPIFGLGFGDWERPAWMHSGSMDNFWLVNAVRYGVPSFVLLASACLVLCRINARSREHALATGWVIGMIGLIVAGCTVHYWNQAHVFFMMYLGIGASIANSVHAIPLQGGVAFKP
jgi:hypothetical protein